MSPTASLPEIIAHRGNAAEFPENTLPALERGLTRSDRRRASLEVICATLVVTAADEKVGGDDAVGAGRVERRSANSDLGAA